MSAVCTPIDRKEKKTEGDKDFENGCKSNGKVGIQLVTHTISDDQSSTNSEVT